MKEKEGSVASLYEAGYSCNGAGRVEKRIGRNAEGASQAVLTVGQGGTNIVLWDG